VWDSLGPSPSAGVLAEQPGAHHLSRPAISLLATALLPPGEGTGEKPVAALERSQAHFRTKPRYTPQTNGEVRTVSFKNHVLAEWAT